MEYLGYADRQDLLRWADSIAARSDLPRLMRRLILETARDVIQIGVPAGEGTSAAGWDGTVRTTQATAFVPVGLSVWEMSVEKSVGAKADRDYAKRETTPDGSPTQASIYVAAALRPWTARAKWARERTTDGRWAEVRAYGVDDVEAWLETAPVTWAWLSERLGLHPTGLRSAESWWDSWSTRTTPATPPALILAGRSDHAKALLSRLDGVGQLTTAGGASRNEILAFIAAVGIHHVASDGGKLLSRTAFVEDIRAWRRLVVHPEPLVLVPIAEGLADEIPSRCVHHILVPVVGSAVADIDLPPIDATEAANALRATKEVEDERATDLGRLSRRSLTALRRRIASTPDLHQPPWAAAPASRTVRGPLLVGSWADGSAADQAVVADITGEPYEELRESLAVLASSEDPFLSLDAGSWSVVSLHDAWLLLRGQLREDDVSRLEGAVRVVLREQDPALDLPEDERWKASLHGKVREHSGALRLGLARTLALLAAHGDSIRAGNGQTGVHVASYLVRTLLEEANADATGKRWASLSDLLPLLAEAGPDSFVDAARDGVTGSDPVLALLFTDSPEGDVLFSSSSPHTGLLWAMETLAWSSEHFGQAVDLLARLDAIDPGGRLNNRPFGSLESIFTPWHPENSVEADRRLDVIDGLRQRHRAVAWRLLLSMLPEFHGIHMPTHEPQFRDWKPPQQPVTRVEYFSFVAEVVGRAIADAGQDPARWSELIERATQLPPEDRRRVVAALDELASSGSLNDADTTELWQSLRDLVGKHREYSSADWALPSEETDALDALAAKLEPVGSLERHTWLFSEHLPHLGDETRRADHAAYETELAALRQVAVREIEHEGGLDNVHRLAEASVIPWAVGIGLADATGDAHIDALLPALDMTDRNARLDLTHAFFSRRFSADGWPWLDSLLSEHPDLTARQQARLLLAAREYPKAWDVADERGEAVAGQFWRLFSYVGLGGGFAEIETVAQRLMNVGRHAATLAFLGIYARRGRLDEAQVARLTADALDGLLHTNDPELRYLQQHDFQEMFALLERQSGVLGEDRVASLEWSCLPALGFDPHVPSLHRFMASDPSFFIRIVSAVYRPREVGSDDPEASNDEGDRQSQAMNGYRLLASWRQVPGVQDDGRLDSKLLHEWVDEAQHLLSEAERYRVGAVHIGQVLVSAPTGSDGRWPHEAVRDLFEELQSDELEEGFYIELLNRRGVTSRGLEDGGAQERELAEQYAADAKHVADRWPRVAAVLRKIAKSYENQAQQNEEQAERFRRGLER
jgi:hypothetical protein